MVAARGRCSAHRPPRHLTVSHRPYTRAQNGVALVPRDGESPSHAAICTSGIQTSKLSGTESFWRWPNLRTEFVADVHSRRQLMLAAFSLNTRRRRLIGAAVVIAKHRNHQLDGATTSVKSAATRHSAADGHPGHPVHRHRRGGHNAHRRGTQQEPHRFGLGQPPSHHQRCGVRVLAAAGQPGPPLRRLALRRPRRRDLLRFFIGDVLRKTAALTNTNAIRKKHASRTREETPTGPRVPRINPHRSVNHQPTLNSPTACLNNGGQPIGCGIAAAKMSNGKLADPSEPRPSNP